MDATIKSVALAVMALGLNIVVGFAGLLDLGLRGLLCDRLLRRRLVRVRILLQGQRPRRDRPHWSSGGPGIHLNFALIMIAAAVICAIAGIIIGLPTLRLRGDYIAIVTLAFGEIIGVVAVNGQDIHVWRRA